MMVLLPEKSHGRRSLVGSSPWGREELGTNKRLHFHFSLSCIGEGNGNLLQCSCLENPRDNGAWWAAVYGVAQSWTRLKRLSSSSSSRGVGHDWSDLAAAGGCLGFLCGSAVKESTCNAGATGNVGSIPGLGRSPGGGHDNPLQYSCLENPMDRVAWLASP